MDKDELADIIDKLLRQFDLEEIIDMMDLEPSEVLEMIFNNGYDLPTDKL